jgi:hypothetical protein
MTAHFMVSFHTHNRDKRRDPITNTVTRRFSSLVDARAWAATQSPTANIYEHHAGLGWWSINCPRPGVRQ